MSGYVYDYHEITQHSGEKLSDTVSRHLIQDHERAHLSGRTLNEMSAIHAKQHYFGNDHPETDSETTRRQKRQLNERLVAMGVTLPDWVITHSFLSDLRTLVKLIEAAHRAGPGVPVKVAERYPCCIHCDHSISQPEVIDHDKVCTEPGCQEEPRPNQDSSTTMAPEGIDNAGK